MNKSYASSVFFKKNLMPPSSRGYIKKPEYPKTSTWCSKN
jgi:hypothetical protein